MPFNHFQQFLASDWFGQVIIATGMQRLFAIISHGICGQSDDRMGITD